jgi:flagellin-like hook-associated protein FlgL
LKSGIGAFQPGADSLTVKFNERTENAAINQLVVSGLKTADFTTIMARSAVAVGTPGTNPAIWGQTGAQGIKAITASVRAIDSALVTVRQAAQEFGTNAAMLTIRADFTTNIINTLKGGAADLVNADMNEESANLLSLQTRQQLGTISLSIAQRSEQSILRLF